MSLERVTLHLQVNLEVVSPRYLVHWFNDTPIGQVILEILALLNPDGKVTPENLLAATLHLPSIEEQGQTLAALDRLNRIRAETDEMEDTLWATTGELQGIVKEIETINTEDRFTDWFESLPFPLASILWRYHAQGEDGNYKDRNEALLHFFECTAAFLAILHLSAFSSDEELWREHGPRLKDLLSKQGLSLTRTTFGAWKLIVEYLSAAYGKLRTSEEDEARTKQLYATSDRSVLDMLCSRKLRTILQTTNKIRNDTRGHGGPIDDARAKKMHDELKALVQELRSVFGRVWQRYELIQPSTSRYTDGVHNYNAELLTGSRNTFKSETRSSPRPLEDGALYLFDQMNQTGLRLLPFIRVMPSPQTQVNACYIFNRQESEGSRFVSYHFEQESEITQSFPEVAKALSRLQDFNHVRDA